VVVAAAGAAIVDVAIIIANVKIVAAAMIRLVFFLLFLILFIILSITGVQSIKDFR
jgi:hypothetical protein